MNRRNFLMTAGATAATVAGRLGAAADVPERKLLSAIRAGLVARQELTANQKRAIVDVGISLVDQVYVHRTMKMAQYGIDVVPQLRALRTRAAEMKDMSFHREMRRIFVQLRDRHTHYISGEHNEAYTLDLTIARGFENGEWKYFVIKSDNLAVPVGSEVVSWNGGGPEQVVTEFANNVGAGNVASRLAVARRYLTTRLTSMFDPPVENEVHLSLVDPAGVKKEALLNWHVARHPGKFEVPAEHTFDLGIDAPLFVTESEADSNWVSSRKITFRGQDFGLLHIKTFNSPANFMDQILEKIKPLPPTGLVIDIRQNGGGIISHGESLLRLFTSKRIEPLTFRARASETMAAAATAHRGWHRWHATIAQGVAFGSEYSADFRLTAEEDANCTRQVYFGPVVLLVDGITYSTSDMFASGFQSHGIGKIIGIDDNIGAGGANNLHSIKGFVPKDDPRFPPLPAGVDFGMAVRQAMRTGPYSGMLLEDEGIKIDFQYKLTKQDVLPATKDRDLLAYACGLLAG